MRNTNVHNQNAFLQETNMKRYSKTRMQNDFSACTVVCQGKEMDICAKRLGIRDGATCKIIDAR